MRQSTDVLEDDFPPHGQAMMDDRAWSVTHEPEPPTQPQAAQRPKRVRQRPHRKYSDPHEMWEWHWARMKIVLAWTAVGTSCGITGTAAWVILGEFL